LKEILNIDELSEYLCIKKSNLYSKVERKEIPFYKIGHLVRFKRSDIDLWMERSKVEPSDLRKKVKATPVATADKQIIDGIVDKAIARTRSPDYTVSKGRPHRIRVRGLRKEVSDGNL
jgi:excisionase family DNA binding protein